MIAVLMSLPAEAPAANAEWVRVGGDDKAAEFVDAKSLVRVADEVRFRREIRFAPTRPEGFDRMAFSSVGSCRDRTVFEPAMSLHLGDHELMSTTFRKGRKTVLEVAPPNSPLGRALAFACDGSTGKEPAAP
ncbi:MAG TPA: hypothetical protein VFQ67_09055 [Allosphingosinicella sp.]|nr:hypothetical protein [Allosphingosinicella sp.]